MLLWLRIQFLDLVLLVMMSGTCCTPQEASSSWMLHVSQLAHVIFVWLAHVTSVPACLCYMYPSCPCYTCPSLPMLHVSQLAHVTPVLAHPHYTCPSSPMLHVPGCPSYMCPSLPKLHVSQLAHVTCVPACPCYMCLSLPVLHVPPHLCMEVAHSCAWGTRSKSKRALVAIRPAVKLDGVFTLSPATCHCCKKDSGCGGFFFACKDFLRIFDNSFPTCAFFFFFPKWRLGQVH